MMLVFAPAIAAPPAMPRLRPADPAWALDAYEICFPSGFLVHVVRRPEAGIVALTAVVGAGESLETDANRGAAHLVEHLWFQSHPAGGASPWELEPGLEMQGETSADVTVFTTVGSPADLEALLALEVQRLIDPLQGVDAATVEREKRVVRSELAWRGAHAERAARLLLDTRLWPEGHRYARTVASLAEVDELSLDVVRRFAAANYEPRTTALRIEGDVDAEAVSKALGRLVPDGWARGEVTQCGRHREAGPPPNPRSTDLVQVPAPVRIPRLYLSWSLPAAFGPDQPQQELATGQLLLALTVHRIDPDWHYHPSCEWVGGRQASVMTCSIEVASEREAERDWEVIRSHLVPRDTDQYWFGSQLVLDASEYYLDTIARLDGFDDDDLMWRGLGTWTGDVDPVRTLATALAGITPDEVGELERRWLTRDRMAAVLLVPEDAQPLTAPDAPSDAPTVSLPPWHAPSPALAASAERLENGLETWVVRRRDAPYLAYTALVTRGGWATSPFPGAAEVLDAVESHRIPLDLGTMEARSHVEPWTRSGPMARAVEVRAPESLLSLAMWLHRVTGDVGELDLSERQPLLDAVVEDAFSHFRADPDSTAMELRVRWLLGAGPLGAPWWERYKAARRVPSRDLRQWQRSVHRPDRSALVVVSGLDPVVVRGATTKMLGGWRSRGDAVDSEPPALAPPPPRRTFVLPDRTELVDLMLSCRLPGRTDASAPALDVLTQLVRQGSVRALRHGLGLYDVGVEVEGSGPRLSVLTLHATAWPATAAAARDRWFALLEHLAAGPDPVELEAGRLAAASAHARQLASARGTFELLESAAFDGRSLASVVGHADAIAQVDGPTVAALLTDCAGHEAVTVTGPTADVAGEQVDWRAAAEARVDALL